MNNDLIIFSAKYLYLVIAALAAVYFLIKPAQRKQLAILVLISFPIVLLLSRLAGLLYFDPRPFVAGHFTPLIPHSPDNGFVSDHSLLASAVAAVIFAFNKKWGAILFVLAIIVGAGRVLAGLHRVADVVGAFAISIIVVWLVDLAIKKYQLKKHSN